MKTESKSEESIIWYDVNNQNLYKNLSVKEVFEWLESTNRFIWKSLTEEQRKQKLTDKINAGKELFD